MIKDLVLKNRSYRRFFQEEIIDISSLKEFIDLARLSPSGANRQVLKFLLSNTEEKNNIIFSSLAWAGYYKDWDGPCEGEKPSAYIVMLRDKNLGNNTPQDEGIAAQSILLGATEKGFGGCMIGNVNRKKLMSDLNLKENYEIAMVIALGVPREEIAIEAVKEDGDIKYWRDKNQVHHVPKRALEDIIL